MTINNEVNGWLLSAASKYDPLKSTCQKLSTLHIGKFVRKCNLRQGGIFQICRNFKEENCGCHKL